MQESKQKLIDVIQQSRDLLPKEILDFIDRTQKEPHPESQLIAVLRKTQDHFGYLENDKLEAIAQLLQVPAAKVYGVASFYHYFRLKQRGKFIISLCMGTACYVKGAEAVLNKFKEELGIELGETTKDGMFSLEQTRCLGTCALAPVVKIGEDIHPQMTSEKVPLLIAQYMEKEKQ